MAWIISTTIAALKVLWIICLISICVAALCWITFVINGLTNWLIDKDNRSTASRPPKE